MSTTVKVPEPKITEITKSSSSSSSPALSLIPHILHQLTNLHISNTKLYANLNDITLGPSQGKGNLKIALNRFKHLDAKGLEARQSVILVQGRSYLVNANVSVSVSNITTDQHVAVLFNLFSGSSVISSSHVEFVSSGNRTQNISLNFVVTASGKETLSLGLDFEADAATTYTYEVLSGAFSVTAL